MAEPTISKYFVKRGFYWLVRDQQGNLVNTVMEKGKAVPMEDRAALALVGAKKLEPYDPSKHDAEIAAAKKKAEEIAAKKKAEETAAKK